MRTFITRVEIEGLENLQNNGRPVCYVANHQSMLDIPAVIGGLGIWAGFIAKKELKRVPLVNFWIQSINCVYIDRTSPRSSIEAIIKGVDHIRKGIPMFVFPEGTRSKDGNLGQFKSGSLKLATRAKADIVPIVINGTRAALEDRKNFRRMPVVLSVCKPIPTMELDDEGMKILPDRVYGSIADRYQNLRRIVG